MERQLASVNQCGAAENWRGKTMIHGLHAVLAAILHSGTIPLDWKKGVGRFYLERERDH